MICAGLTAREFYGRLATILRKHGRHESNTTGLVTFKETLRKRLRNLEVFNLAGLRRDTARAF